jgi:hypothetical protein
MKLLPMRERKKNKKEPKKTFALVANLAYG